ncbi:hypothetical protein HNO86_07540 [Pseudomonas sp. C1C7]|jgi:hypothetical protein|uniref:hypothetical protein n=1 Tax=Pseudomonas sp. C1C7 TaxID=2735272 RepID=UPI00158629AB|nr:hypothetical protein [Pseudomonas sp. C1C7]NUT74893.1 hypothetical protein [Pseudomonas sp. C1C7]
MQKRFVLLPSIPVERETFRARVRNHAQADPDGFDIYDNMKKERLKKGYSDRADGEAACIKLNADSSNLK